ncbi:hypothetical protein [Gordonia sp. 'Campus']|uniref:hypothetical protein n=1 Tax=Gordonia sp. 'Campus' TaxID=2915824 RepID=UPI001EE4CD64|nr:hypothetical protein [Gordonia sp. 'Campus']
MADDDQRDGHPVTPDGHGTTSTDLPGTDRPGSGDRRNAKRPVRSAPIRRGRPAAKKASKVAPASETGTAAEPKPVEPATTVATRAGTDGDASVDAPTAPEADSPADAAIAPDPSEVEKTVSYRERRRARMASPAGDDASPTSRRGIRYRGSGRRSPRAIVGVVVALVVIVVCAIASVVFALGISRQDRLDDLRAEYSSFASQVLVNLTSMNPENVDRTLTSVQEDTSGKVKQEVQNNIQQVAALVRDGKLETRSIILSSAVTKAEPDEGSVIMVFGWHQKSLDGEVPSQEKVFRWRVDMTRINGELKMTDFEWVA